MRSITSGSSTKTPPVNPTAITLGLLLEALDIISITKSQGAVAARWLHRGDSGLAVGDQSSDINIGHTITVGAAKRAFTQVITDAQQTATVMVVEPVSTRVISQVSAFLLCTSMELSFV